MKKTFKFGLVILVLGAVLAIVGAVSNGIKPVEFNGFKVQTVKKDTRTKKEYAKKEFNRIEIENEEGDVLPLSVEIKQGKDYSVAYQGSSRFEPKLNYQNGTLKISRGSELSKTVSFDFTDYRSKIDSSLVITVPENVKLATLKVDGAFNTLRLEKLNIATLELDPRHSERVELTEVTTERTDVEMESVTGVHITNSKLNNGDLEFNDLLDFELVVAGGEFNNLKVRTDGHGKVYYKDGLVLNGGMTQLGDVEYGIVVGDNDAEAEHEAQSDGSADLFANTITVKGKYEIKNNHGLTQIENATVQGYRLTNKHGKNTLREQQQTNGGTLEEGTDQADVLILTNETGENIIK